MPSQYPISGHYRPESETPFRWRFACGSIVARFLRAYWVIRRLITNSSGTKTAQEILDEQPRLMRACVSSILYKIARKISIRHYRSPSLQLLIIDCDPGWVCVCVCVCGGGYSHFFFIRRIGPSIYRLPPKKIGNIKHPKATQIYSLSVHLPLEKTLKYIEKTPKTSPILSWPPKNILKISYPQKILNFWTPPKIM